MLTRTLYLLLLCIACMHATAQSKNAFASHRHVVKINFHTDIVKGGIPLSFEVKTARKQSVQLSLNYTYWKSGIGKTSGPGFAIEYRFYLPASEPGISGIYLGPDLSYNNLTYKQDEIVQTSNVIGGGLILGYKWVWKNHLSLDLNAALDVKATGGTKEFIIGRTDYPRDGFVPRIGIAVGYAF